MGCYIWYSEEGTGRGTIIASGLPRVKGTLIPHGNGPLYSNTVIGTLAILAVPNVTVHPSTASVPIAVLLYDGPLVCGFTVPIKG